MQGLLAQRESVGYEAAVDAWECDNQTLPKGLSTEPLLQNVWGPSVGSACTGRAAAAR